MFVAIGIDSENLIYVVYAYVNGTSFTFLEGRDLLALNKVSF